jgi:hypothetical protein
MQVKVNSTSNSKTVKLCKGNRTGVHSTLVVSLHKINKACWVNKLQLEIDRVKITYIHHEDHYEAYSGHYDKIHRPPSNCIYD